MIGVKTGHTAAAGWSEVGAVRGPGVTVYATMLGSPSRRVRNDGLGGLMTWGLSRFRVVQTVTAGRVYARAAHLVRQRRRRSRRAALGRCAPS